MAFLTEPQPALEQQPLVASVYIASQGDALLQRAEDAQEEQTAVIEASSLESQYRASLDAQIETKHDQAERIEDRLEGLISLQTARLQAAQSTVPGRMSLPGTRARWQEQIQRQQSTIQRLEGRLEQVREIRDGMGVHAPRIEELAAKRMKHRETELVEGWEEMQVAMRRHQALIRKREQNNKQAERSASLGRGLSLGISRSVDPT